MNVYIQWAETCLTCRHTVEWHIEPLYGVKAIQCQHPQGVDSGAWPACKCRDYQNGGAHQLVWGDRMLALAPPEPMH